MDSDLHESFIRLNKEREKIGMPPVSRRAFLRLTALAAFGLTFPFASTCTGNSAAAAGSQMDVAVKGRINYDPDKCVGCGVCGLMCALYHYGEQSPTLSRSELVRDPFTYDHSWYVCQQCETADCYHACPKKDNARLIDPITKAKYVNEEECMGCGACIEACPQEPVRIRMHPTKHVAMNCDLCRGRDDGPICVQFCTMHALSYTQIRG